MKERRSYSVWVWGKDGTTIESDRRTVRRFDSVDAYTPEMAHRSMCYWFSGGTVFWVVDDWTREAWQFVNDFTKSCEYATPPVPLGVLPAAFAWEPRDIGASDPAQLGRGFSLRDRARPCALTCYL